MIEQHFQEYTTTGFTVLKGLIPPSLLSDLRREAEKAPAIARQAGGPQAQRLQPIYRFEELNPRPFRDFLQLAPLREAVETILGPEHQQSDIMGILLEPQNHAWCTNWHRDWRDHVAGLSLERYHEAVRNLRQFNQLNAALYDDHSLWVAPGSHNRPENEDERAVFPTVPTPGPLLSEGMSGEERERACQEYARRMPGATPLMLLAGDCAFYRACLWHMGNYVPYARRATLHDGFYGPEDRAWQAEMRQLQEARG